jgi:hypothetical protein
MKTIQMSGSTDESGRGEGKSLRRLISSPFSFTLPWWRTSGELTPATLLLDGDPELCIRATERNVQTLYFGKRPNCIRIYDKLAELRSRALELRPDESVLLNPIERPGRVLTRVERQCGGGRIPAEVATVGTLLKNARSLDPFEYLELRKGDYPHLMA